MISIGLISSFFRRRGLTILCLGIVIFWEIENISVELPNNPVSIAKRGCFTGRVSVAKPKNPARIKIIIAENLEFFSCEIKKIEIQIKNQAIIFWIKG